MKVVVRCSRRDRLPELRYVLDVFASARCRTWEFIHAGDEPGDGDLRLNYGREVYDERPGSINIPCTDGPLVAEYARYSPGAVPFFVSTRDPRSPGPGRVMIEETGSRAPLMVVDPSRRSVTFGFDVIENAFRWLSCALERQRERSRGPIRSYAARLGLDRGVLQVACVNRYFEALERSAAEATGRARDQIIAPLRYPDGARFAVCLTHDVDAVAKSTPLRTKRLAFDLYHLVRRSRSRGGRIARGRVAWRRLVGPGSYWYFDRIAGLEAAFGWRSTYFVYARAAARAGAGWGSWLLDPSYDIARDAQLQAKLRDLRRLGHEVALHGSYRSHASPTRLAAEKAVLERVLDAPVHGNRQHWLRFSVDETWPGHERVGLAYDATLGFNDVPGFRAGIAVPFHPWDHHARRPLRLVAIPTVLMDSTLFDYMGLDAGAAEERALAILEEVAAVGGAVAIIWHQQVFGEDYRWGSVYARILEWVRAQGGCGTTCWDVAAALDR